MKNRSSDEHVSSDDESGVGLWETTRYLCLLDDSETQRDDLRTRLETEGFIVLTPANRSDCLSLLEHGCRTFVLDVDLGGGSRKIEGLATLQDIKARDKSVFCAVVTGFKEHRNRAVKFGADLFLGKTARDLDTLIEKINENDIGRRLAVEVEGPLTVQSLGKALRIKDANRLAGVVADLRAAFPSIDQLVDSADFEGAARELVILEPGLRDLVRDAKAFGDGLGIAVHALRNSVRQQGSLQLTRAQWTGWTEVFEHIAANPHLNVTEACQLALKLEDLDLNTEPVHWKEVSEMLSHLSFGPAEDSRD